MAKRKLNAEEKKLKKAYDNRLESTKRKLKTFVKIRNMKWLQRP